MNWILSLRESYYQTSRNLSHTYLENLIYLLLKRVSSPRSIKIMTRRRRSAAGAAGHVRVQMHIMDTSGQNKGKNKTREGIKHRTNV